MVSLLAARKREATYGKSNRVIRYLAIGEGKSWVDRLGREGKEEMVLSAYQGNHPLLFGPRGGVVGPLSAHLL